MSSVKSLLMFYMTFYMTCDDGAKEEPFKQGALLCEECECDIVSFHSPGTGIRNSVSVYFMYEFPSSICPQFSLRPVFTSGCLDREQR